MRKQKNPRIRIFILSKEKFLRRLGQHSIFDGSQHHCHIIHGAGLFFAERRLQHGLAFRASLKLLGLCPFAGAGNGLGHGQFRKRRQHSQL